MRRDFVFVCSSCKQNFFYVSVLWGQGGLAIFLFLFECFFGFKGFCLGTFGFFAAWKVFFSMLILPCYVLAYTFFKTCIFRFDRLIFWAISNFFDVVVNFQ